MNSNAQMVNVRLRNEKGIPADYSVRSRVLVGPGKEYIPDGTTKTITARALVHYVKGETHAVPQEDADMLLALSTQTKTREGAKVTVPWFEIVPDNEAAQAVPLDVQMAELREQMATLTKLAEQAQSAPVAEEDVPVVAAADEAELPEPEPVAAVPAGVTSDMLGGEPPKRGPGRPPKAQ